MIFEPTTCLILMSPLLLILSLTFLRNLVAAIKEYRDGDPERLRVTIALTSVIFFILGAIPLLVQTRVNNLKRLEAGLTPSLLSIEDGE